MKDIYNLIQSALTSQKDVQFVREIAVNGCHVFEYKGGPGALENRCVFDVLSDEQSARLLKFYLSERGLDALFNWEINVELAKLSAKRGFLVRGEAEQCLYVGFEKEHWIDNVLRVAYFGSDIRYEKRLVDLIEKRTGDCGDGYDGLFIACWFMNSPRVDTALAERFVDWLQNDTLDRGGCSLTDVFRLIDKWERKGRCVAYEGLRDLYRDYIKRHGDVPYFKDQGLW